MKRGQLSFFIIIGIILLIVIGLLFFFRAEILKSKLQKEVQTIETVPEQLRSVKESIDNCVAKVGSDGSTIIGLQGGYIEIPKDSLPRGIFNKFSNSLQVMPNLNVASWFYETNNGIQRTQIPSKINIKDDLNSYIKNNLDACLTSLEDYKDQGYSINFNGNIKVDSNIQDEFIEVLVDYPVNIEYKGIGKSLSKHYAKLDIPLGQLYNLGVDILNSENSQYYFENKTLDILSVYDDIPYAGQSLNCVPKVWFKNDIEQKLKDYIRVNTGAIKIKNNLGISSQSYYMLDPGKKYDNVDVNFVYEKDWPIDLSINGGEEILKEDQIVGTKNPATKLLVGIFCLNSYQFVYDIKYPVLVQLTKKGYTFEYAIQSIIDNNQPRLNRRGFDNLGDSEKIFCKAATKKNIVYALNFEDGKNLVGSDINVKCISSECNVGKTADQDDGAYLEADLPSCLNAEIIASKQGFNDGVAIVNTNEEGTINVELKPKHKLKIEIKVIENGEIRDLNDEEDALIQFLDEQDNYATIANKNIDSIELITGSYNINAYLVENTDGLTLSGSEVEKCIDVPKSGILGLIGLKDKKCFTSTIDPIKLEQIVSGGNNFDFEFNKDDLSTANRLVFYVTKNKTPTNVEELRSEIDLINTNSENPEYRMPQLI